MVRAVVVRERAGGGVNHGCGGGVLARCAELPLPQVLRSRAPVPGDCFAAQPVLELQRPCRDALCEV